MGSRSFLPSSIVFSCKVLVSGHFNKNNLVCYIGFVYGAPIIAHRQAVWHLISPQISNIQGPLILIGDFIQVESPKDKIGHSNDS